MRQREIALMFGLVAIAGCSSNGPSSASGVFPSSAFTGRTTRVEISGDGTSWADGAMVDFGTGVTVSNVTVASPTDVLADIAVDPATATGLHDVTVTSGGTFTLKQAFELRAPVKFAFQGTAAQGGLPYYTITNLDIDNPFDSTTDATGAFANLKVTGPAGVDFTINTVTELSINGRAFIDTDAGAGGPVSVASGASGAQVMSTSATSATIMARSPTPLTAGTLTTGALASIGDSQLYSIAATGTPSLVHVTLSTTDTGARLAGAIFTDTKWATAAGLHAIVTGPATVDFVVADLGTSPGYSFKVTGAGEMLTGIAEGNTDAQNGTIATPLVSAALPGQLTGATLSSANDVDMVKFTVSAGNANKRLHVVTDGGTDPQTDTTVGVVDSTGNTYFTSDPFTGAPGPIDGSDCSFFGCTSLGEDVVSNPLPAGTYFVKIAAGGQYAAAHNSYLAIYWFE